MPKPPDIAIRLNAVFMEWKKKQPTAHKGIRYFADDLGYSAAQIHGMLKGTREISHYVIDVVCNKMGYSSEWFIKGTGTPRAKDEGDKLVTEIKALRTELKLARQELDVRNIRQGETEKEVQELKTRLASLESMIRGLMRDKAGTYEGRDR